MGGGGDSGLGARQGGSYSVHCRVLGLYFLFCMAAPMMPNTFFVCWL